MSKEAIVDEIVLNDDELVCLLTESKKKASAKELILQSVIQQMNDEYGFEFSDMERDYKFSYEDEDGHRKRCSVDLAIFRTGMSHEKENLVRLCVVNDNRVGSDHRSKGVVAALHAALLAGKALCA